MNLRLLFALLFLFLDFLRVKGGDNNFGLILDGFFFKSFR